MSSVKNDLNNGLNNQYIEKDITKYESEINIMKIMYEEGGHPLNIGLLCNALRSYKEYLERSKATVSEKLGEAKPEFIHINDEISFIEDGIEKECV
ncbi:MAG: hypothetical protein ACRD8W_19925 [Nitrososphaeraceae archaeon]